jgi:glycerophosphoryl diester phosphodiesterase
VPHASGSSPSSLLGRSPIVYAHRGAAYELPENTLEAFALALELGADAIETDAHMTRDGHVVLSHDATGERNAGVPRAIRDATLAEVLTWDVGARFVPRGRDGRLGPARPFRMPTLDEALARFPDVVFNVDAKQESPDMIPALMRSIRRADAEERVRVASFSMANLRHARVLGCLHTGLAAVELGPLILAPLTVARRLPVAGEAAQVPIRASRVRLASERVIDRLHVLGLRVDFWTVDDPELARRLFAMGADGVMTDDPRRVSRPALAQRSS